MVNGDSKIGSGHFGRCMNIAKGLSNHQITFISWSLDTQFQETLRDQGISFLHIAPEEAKYLAAKLSDGVRGLLITDTDDLLVYEATFQQSIRAKGLKLMIITVDDRHHYFADRVMNQSILSLEQHFKTEEYTKLLLGPRYFIFDEKYRAMEPKPVRTAGNSVFIGFGAADPKYYSRQILQALETGNGFENWTFKLVLGPLNSDERVAEIRQMAEESQWSIEVYYDVKELQELYDQCDLAICSPGRMFWELALYGVRSLIYSSAEREIPSADFLHRHKFATLIQQCDEPWDGQQLLAALDLQDEIAPKLAELQNQINPDGLKYICKEIEETVKY